MSPRTLREADRRIAKRMPVPQRSGILTAMPRTGVARLSRKCTRWLAILLLAGPLSNALAETPTTAENALQRLLQQPRQQLDALADDGLYPGHYHRQALARPDDLAPACREAQASHAYLLALQHL